MLSAIINELYEYSPRNGYRLYFGSRWLPNYQYFKPNLYLMLLMSDKVNHILKQM